ncbi:MAG TPA: DUF3871 family protein [Chitinophagaceae bacterium]
MDNTLSLVPVQNRSTDESSFIPFEEVSTDKPFIRANTIGCSLEEIRSQHLIPVYAKDNERLISGAEFIEVTQSVVAEMFKAETILKPTVRLSHPIKGRIPEAKDKPANALEDWERTIFYERMAFIIEIPSINDLVDGNTLSLTIGGIKSYNLDNLYNKKGADEHFKIFIGFQNKICLNLCVWTDGTMMDLKVSSIGQLQACIRSLIQNYNQQHHMFHLKQLCNYSLTEHQFAQLIGRARMYQYLPNSMKNDIPPLLFGDNQMGSVVRDFYKDDSFCKMDDGTINLWRLFNLFTNANKSTYIDQFVERGVNAFSFVYNIKAALQNKTFNWYLK